MVYRYEELNHVQLAMLPRDRTVFFIPVSPLEEHGPHLPYGVDAMLARFYCETLGDRLQKSFDDWSFVLLPTMYVGADTLKFLGSIEVKQSIVRDVVYAVASKIARDGFRHIVAMSAHGGPRHIVALEEVAAKISWRFRGTRMVSATGRIITDALRGTLAAKLELRMKERGEVFSPEDLKALKTDYHAGMIETSLMMVVRPDLVKDEYKNLKPAIVEKYWKIRPSSGMKVGGGFGHLGSPSHSRKAIGEAAIEVFMDELLPRLTRFMKGEKGLDREFRSFYYLIPIFRTHFTYFVVLFVSFLVFFGAMAYFMNIMAGFVSRM